jgi:hypothetical protein
MKKYVSGLLAVIVALTLNSFTIAQKSSPQKTGEALIWYYIDGSGQIDPDNPINPGDPVDEADLESIYNACLGTGLDCARGFRESNLPVHATDLGVAVTQKSL